MAIKKVVSEANIGKGLAVADGKVNVNIDAESFEFDASGMLKAKQMENFERMRGDELQDLAGNHLGYFVKE